MDRLPVEMVQLICSQLCRHCTREATLEDSLPWHSRNSLYPIFVRHNLARACAHDSAPLRALCLTSRALRAIAQPILHHELDLDTDPEDYEASPTLFLFARTVVQNRRLAASTRRITSTRLLHAWFPPYQQARQVIAQVLPNFAAPVRPAVPSRHEQGHDGRRHPSSGENASLAIYLAFCQALNHPITPTIPGCEPHIEFFSSGALLAMVAGLLPNLASFSQAERLPCLLNMYRSVFDAMHASLPRLRHFSCIGPVESLVDVVRAAPNLAELHIHDLQRFRGAVPRLPRLRALRIVLPVERAGSLHLVESILDACEGGLRDFAYYQYHPSRQVEANRSVRYSLLGTSSTDNDIFTDPEWEVPDLEGCLGRHKASLARLDLDVQQRPTREGGIPTLTDYDNVDTLTISPWYADYWYRVTAANTTVYGPWGFESFLPRNLRVLRLRLPWTSALCRHLLEMLLALADSLHATDRSSMPSLQVVECVSLVDTDWRERLHEAFSRAGIQFKTAYEFWSSHVSDSMNRLLHINTLYPGSS
ncbi:hypothetical protein E4U53_004281 [Claviceps sorghi]|nr:hypothetical protein E4U53_004281 [Claviceps sorghi]